MSSEILARLARIAFWAALIFAYVCAVIPGGPEIGHSDKTGHILAFATLAFFARLGWQRNSALKIIVALFCFGVFIELSQALPIVHRDCDPKDVAADSIGIAIGLSLALMVGWLGIGRGRAVR